MANSLLRSKRPLDKTLEQIRKRTKAERRKNARAAVKRQKHERHAAWRAGIENA